MGCMLSSEERAAVQRSKQIDKMLKLEAERAMGSHEAEILLIGTRYSGKSSLWNFIKTIFRDESTSYDQAFEHGDVVVPFSSKNAHFKIIQLESRFVNRRQLFHFFERASAVIVIVSMSNYDLMTDDDPPKNVLLESMETFASICNNEHFEDTLLFLVWSKADLFKEKLTATPLSVCFPNYSGPNTFEDSGTYIQNKFENDCDVNKTEREIYSHFIDTPDANNVTFLIDAVTDVIVRPCHHCCDALLL